METKEPNNKRLSATIDLIARALDHFSPDNVISSGTIERWLIDNPDREVGLSKPRLRVSHFPPPSRGKR